MIPISRGERERCSARTHATVRGHVGDLIAISFGLRSVLTLCSSCKLFVESIDLTSKVTAAADLVQLRKLYYCTKEVIRKFMRQTQYSIIHAPT